MPIMLKHEAPEPAKLHIPNPLSARVLGIMLSIRSCRIGKQLGLVCLDIVSFPCGTSTSDACGVRTL